MSHELLHVFEQCPNEHTGSDKDRRAAEVAGHRLGVADAGSRRLSQPIRLASRTQIQAISGNHLS